MKNPKSINELLKSGGKRLSSLSAKSAARTSTLESVCASLPPDLAQAVVSAGLDAGKLTIGVASPAWAARLRYAVDDLRLPVAKSLGADIYSVRVKIVPSQA
jgi:hypothetical protein